jgi:hypothetical protein
MVTLFSLSTSRKFWDLSGNKFVPNPVVGCSKVVLRRKQVRYQQYRLLHVLTAVPYKYSPLNNSLGSAIQRGAVGRPNV